MRPSNTAGVSPPAAYRGACYVGGMFSLGNLFLLFRARRLVVSDPDIIGGDPVFRGTRIPVHMIAHLAANRAPPAELLDSYPRLTAEMIRLSPIYAAAYLQRSRPRNQPWRDHKP